MTQVSPTPGPWECPGRDRGLSTSCGSMFCSLSDYCRVHRAGSLLLSGTLCVLTLLRQELLSGAYSFHSYENNIVLRLILQLP